MSRHAYKVDDIVLLRTGPIRNAAPSGAGRVLAILPADAEGISQYRVKFDAENCERHISAVEIDDDMSMTTGRERPGSNSSAGSWINHKSIKTSR